MRIPETLPNSAWSARPHAGRASRFALAGVAAAILIFGHGLAQAQPAAGPRPAGVVYTADERGDSISAVDLVSGAVVTVPISVSPHNVQATADGAWLLAVGDPAEGGHAHAHGGAAHGASQAKGRLLAFDASDLERGAIADIAVGAHPAHVVVDRQTRRAFVTNAGDDAVGVVDLVAGAQVATVGTGRYPHGLRLSPDGRELYVANVVDGTVSVVDAEALAELARIPVGRTPVQVGFTPDGAHVYVSLRDEHHVAVIDVATRRVVARVAVGRNPIQVHATPDGRFVYVANQGTDAEPADTVSAIDTATNAVVATIRTGMGAHGVAVSDDGAFVFVTNIVDGTLSVIEVVSQSVTASYAVGQGPNGVTYRAGAAGGERSQ